MLNIEYKVKIYLGSNYYLKSYKLKYFELSPGLRITDETLEDRLAYDEIFVEYFNAFLALPVSAVTYIP